jgi:hypothetical protein
VCGVRVDDQLRVGHVGFLEKCCWGGLDRCDSAVDWKFDAGDVAAFVRREEERSCGDFFWAAKAAERCDG